MYKTASEYISIEKTAGIGSLLRSAMRKKTSNVSETIDEGRRAFIRPVKTAVVGAAEAMKGGKDIVSGTASISKPVSKVVEKAPVSRRGFLAASTVGGAKAAVAAAPFIGSNVMHAVTLGSHNAPGVTGIASKAMTAERNLKKILQVRDYRMQRVAGVPKEQALMKTYGKSVLRDKKRPLSISKNMIGVANNTPLKKLAPAYELLQMRSA